MASTQIYVDEICQRANLAGQLTAKKMFGEYALYLDGKIVGLICDNQLYLKPTEAGRRLLSSVVEQAPYPGAKPHFRLGDEVRHDTAQLQHLLVVTADALPAPKAKPAKRPTKKA
ncbi:MAG: TfoX/Sxy family protein [Nevskia sp.]|jgi:TfoX/Sxy family transcriptional regulator of competence genes|nr:TfoX/Sxy family protein [Nevskia sp.]MCK9385199.1 TfoX/Sxy family protein [Nevskia sp.]